MKQLLISEKSELGRLGLWKSSIRNRATVVFLTLTMAAALTACGEKAPAENTTSNVISNNGKLSILETEDGYYLNGGISRAIYPEREVPYGIERVHPQDLCYFDKENQTTILLCDKPECRHDGSDSCVATYKQISVINTVLYEGALYIYTSEEINGIYELNLYKAALDGSAIDKVGTAFSVENTAGKGVMREPAVENNSLDNYFIIHKGYAYLPFYVRIGRTSSGFKGGGLVQMDLKTGATKSIYEMEKMNSPYPYELKAVGDYVYIALDNVEGATYGNARRYSIVDDEMQEIYKVISDILPGYILQPHKVDMVTDKYIIVITSMTEYDEESRKRGETTPKMLVFDANTGEYLPDKELHFEEIENGTPYYNVMNYGELGFVVSENLVNIYSLKDEDFGQKIGQMTFEFEGADLHYWFMDCYTFRVANDKLYRIEKPYLPGMGIAWVEAFESDFEIYDVYSCPLNDILEGKGQWEFAYSNDPGVAWERPTTSDLE